MNFRTIFFFITLCFILIICYPGIYYEDMSDVSFATMNAGFISTKPLPIFNCYGAHFIITHLYVFLEKFISIGWYGILNVCFLFFAVVNIYYCLFLSSYNKSNLFRYILFVALFAFIFYDILFLQYTKTSIYLIFSSVWILTYHLRNRKNKSVSSAFFVYNIFLLMIGMLLRPFSILLVVLLYFPILLVQLRQNKELSYKKVFKYFSVFFSMSFFVFLFSSISINSIDKEYSIFAEYKISIWDNGQSMNSLHLMNSRDSIRFECFANYFLPEKSIIDANFLESIGIKKSHSPFLLLKESLHEIPIKIHIAMIRWKELFSDSNENLHIIVVLLLLLLFSFFQKTSLRKQFFYIVWVIVCLVGLSILVKMEARVLFPSILILMVLLAENLNIDIPKNINKRILFIVFLIVMFSNYKFMNAAYCNAKLRLVGQKEINTFILNSKQANKRQYIILDWLSINMLGNRVITLNKMTSKLDWYSIDPGYLIFYPSYFEKQKALSGTTSFDGFMQYVVHHKDKFIFIFSKNRIDLLKKYYKTMYNKEINFILKKPLFTKGNIFNGHYNFYEYSVE